MDLLRLVDMNRFVSNECILNIRTETQTNYEDRDHTAENIKVKVTFVLLQYWLFHGKAARLD